MVDHLGCLAVLLRAGGRMDLAGTMLTFRNLVVMRIDEEVMEDVMMPERFELVLSEMALVRSSFEEAAACMLNRN